MGGRGMHIRYRCDSRKERDNEEDIDVGRWIILKLILDRMGWYELD
jgi:hypothetical protein